MRSFILVVASVTMLAVPAFAHCGKPHPGDKDKTQTSHPMPKPE